MSPFASSVEHRPERESAPDAFAATKRLVRRST
jgi:hypothetical protein